MAVRKSKRTSLMKTLRPLFHLFLMICASSASSINQTELMDNQILFREKGYIINKTTFVHVRFTVNMTEYMEGVDLVIDGLNKTFLDEKYAATLNVYPFLQGDGGQSSIWDQGEFEGLYMKRASDGMLVSKWLYDMFTMSVRDMEDILMVTPEKEEENLQHQRTKRAIIGGILGGIGLGLGIYNTYTIHQIEKHLSKLTTKYNQVVDSVTLLDSNHVALAVDTTMLKNMQKILLTRNYHKIITYVLTSNEKMKRLYNTVKGIINEGRMNRLSPDLIHGEELKLLFTKLSIMAFERGCKMVLERPFDLYKVETTYAYERNGKVFAIYVHVPMVEKDEKLRLYEYVKFPILQSFKANATLIPNVGEETNIAVVPITQTVSSKNPISQHRFRTLSETDLQSCLKINDVYLCGGRNTLRTDIESSCIGGLWLADHKIISKNCEMEILSLREYVAKIGTNKWIIFSPEKRFKSAKCGDNIAETIRLSYQTKLVMPEDCMVALDSHYLTTDTNVNMDFNYKIIQWNFNGDVFQEFGEGMENINEVIQGIVQSKSKFSVGDISHLKHYFSPSTAQIAAIWEYLSSLNIFAWFGNIYIFLTICLIIVGIWFCYRGGCLSAFYKCLCYKKKRGGARSRPRHQNDEDDQEAIHLPPLVPILIPPARPSAPAEVSFENEISYRKSSHEFHARDENDECNPGQLPEGLTIENFVCNHHVKRGGPGHCTGYFNEK